MKFSFHPLLLITALSSSFSSIAASANHLPLMPWPQQISVQSGHFYIPDKKLKIIVTGDNMQEAISRWQKRIEAQTGWILPPAAATLSSVPTIKIIIAKKMPPIPQPDSDERYQLAIDPHGITLKATTRFGAMRGMETLVDRLLKNQQDWQAEQTLRDRLIRWRDNHEAVMKIVKANYMMRDLVPVANDVGEIAELGLVMLDHLKAGKTFSLQQQQDAKKTAVTGSVNA
ncbi:beta-N-acetylhexosaminidase family protein [Xenorhabdus nematophila]|uniref:beta-N-acetylhexosaminidase family protein n=1 Tax=Xenorhabdus nematophila TaxID=628 RepID=UPI0005716995|nr:beta-N-acetylhexosaminidase family protein [Xenorhabdus nematophila]KHD29196.1 hypothetical protein LH67_04880 [Xenorhabdus nematophila]